MNTYVLNRSVVGALMTGPSAGAPLQSKPARGATALNPADCWCVPPDAPALEPLPPKPAALVKPKTGGVGLRSRNQTSAPCPALRPAASLLQFPRFAQEITAPEQHHLFAQGAAAQSTAAQSTAAQSTAAQRAAAQSTAAQRAVVQRVAGSSREPAGVGDVDEAKAFLQRALKGDAFKAFAGEATAASVMAGTISPSAARGLRDLDRKGLLGDAIADSGAKPSIPPQVVRNSVMQALTRFDLGLTAALTAKTDESRAAKTWLAEMLRDPKVTGNSLSDTQAARYIASKMPADVARNIAARGDDVTAAIDHHCDKSWTGADAERISQRFADALKGLGLITDALEKGARWSV